MMHHLKETFSLYGEIHSHGDALIPLIRKLLLEIDVRTHRLGRLTEYVTALFILMNDLDESETKNLIDEIMSKNPDIHPVLRIRLSSLLTFSLSNFHKEHLEAIPVFVSKTVTDPHNVQRKLTEWSESIDADIRHINRIYVIQKDELDYLGEFTRILNILVVVWKHNVISREYVFYHELGHAIDKGDSYDREEREAFADRFASRLIIKSHPFLFHPLIRSISASILLSNSAPEHKRFLQ